MRQDNIIPFHPPHQPVAAPKRSGRLKRLAKLQHAASHSAACRSQAIPRAMAMCEAMPDALLNPAIVARVVIGFAGRKGITITSIPKIFREQLLSLCAAGDPTALMLRDWLQGNRTLLEGA
jgi:hypothetical protein